MRDVVTGFYVDVLLRLIAAGSISTADSVLVVCGGPLDESVMRQVGFEDFTLTNLDEGATDNWQDAENLTYENGSFDLVIVHAGLHHCHSPHRALLEMYRVARKCALAFESRDSLMMRAAVSLGLTLEYEINSISSDGKGGVANTGIPNFVYRWTERDVRNTVASYDPARKPQIAFFYDLRLPIQRLAADGRWAIRIAAMIIEPLSRIFATIAPKQCNEFAFAISKMSPVQPWIVARLTQCSQSPENPPASNRRALICWQSNVRQNWTPCTASRKSPSGKFGIPSWTGNEPISRHPS
jgi:SAM-dependent methyltransferase